MSTEALPRAAEQARPLHVAQVPATRLFWWSLKRELWEHRFLYIAPLAVGALISLANLINVLLPSGLHLGPLDSAAQHQVLESHCIFAALLLMFSTGVVSIFYAVDALYGERRDRSILFWKSMPVSDTVTVLAKLSIPLLLLPLLTFAITLVTQLIMLLVGMMRTGSGVSGQLALGSMWWGEFFHLVAFHGLWWAPFWGWFLMASAWARRAPLLWATLPPLAIAFGEKIAFGTSYFGQWLMFRFVGGMEKGGSQPMSSASLMTMTPLGFITDIHLWTGFLACAVFVVIAIRLRRVRGPI